ncbi:uncharacterized protein KD926_010206 [Aspergillus affinis]|uniref:uncharacterized protein n=1 Tax=Aspergillus affinis TaxID=1070780 RepID=UPI0022FEB138|nr:uncharacterized protein KD926_010206 [Aspergillus affinis]KAI9038873.1 hypothetical protein KD926_010206 [Aspergillus affinis]
MTPENFARHPIDSSSYPSGVASRLRSRDYSPVPNLYGHWSPKSCALEIQKYLVDCATGIFRENLYPEALSLLGLRGLQNLKYPNSLFLHNTFTGKHSALPGWWSAKAVVEPQRIDGKRVHPHLTLGLVQDFNGHENTMIYGELAPIIDVMYARSQQQIISEEDEESLFEPEVLPPSGPRAFESDQRFPILLLSFLRPQHGRVFYACMDDDELVIRQSRLYSFERLATAPFDLFTRLFLSQPLSTA